MRPLIVIMIFMWIVNILLFTSQLGINALAADAGVASPQIYTYEGSVISDYDQGNYTVRQDLGSELPSDEGQIEVDNGNIFTDTFKTVSNWLKGVTGYKYLKAAVTGVPNLLKGMGLPIEVAFSLGALWYCMSIILVVGFITGKL